MSWKTNGAALALALALGTACGKPVLDAADVRRKVSDAAAARVGVPVANAACPGGIKPAAGASFTRDVSFQGGGKLAFSVTQTDAAGALAVAPVGDWMLGDRMETDLATEMFLIGRHDARVDCGDAVMPLALPGQLECAVTGAPGPARIKVTVDAQRAVDWSLVGTP